MCTDYHPNALHLGCWTTSYSSPGTHQNKTRSTNCDSSADNKLDHVGNHHSGNPKSRKGPCTTELLRNSPMDTCTAFLSTTLHFPQILFCRHTRGNLEELVHSQVYPSCHYWPLNILHIFAISSTFFLKNFTHVSKTCKYKAKQASIIYVQSYQLKFFFTTKIGRKF